jgi:hypothetical protein
VKVRCTAGGAVNVRAEGSTILHIGHIDMEIDILLNSDRICVQCGKVRAEWCGETNRKTGREMECIIIIGFGSRNVYCAQKQNTFQTLYQICLLCREIEHFPDGASEICTVHRNRTHSRRYIRNVYCAQKQNTFQMVHQK